MLVLLASSAVLATAMHGGLLLRMATVETAASTAEAEAARAARSAAVLTVAGLVARPGDGAGRGRSGGGGEGGRSSGRGGAADGDDEVGGEEDEIELPPIIRQLLGEQADDINDALDERSDERAVARSLSGDRASTAGATLEGVDVPGEPMLVVIEGRPVRVTLRDAAGGLNINAADEGQLYRYFVAIGLSDREASSLSQQILDWIDADSVPRRRGAEADAYARIGVTPRNGAVQSLDELLYLPGMSASLLARCVGDLALSGAGPHLPSASPAVLLGYGFSPRDAGTIVSMRRSGRLEIESLERVLTEAGQALLDDTRVGPSSLIRVSAEVFAPLPVGPDGPRHVEVLDEAPAGLGDARRFEGLAVLGPRGLRELMMRRASPAATEVQRER
jgi:hypothetical protein